MNSLSRILRLAAVTGAVASLTLIAGLLGAHLTDLFALGASLFVLVIAATDYSSTARRIERMRRLAPVIQSRRPQNGLQLAA